MKTVKASDGRTMEVWSSDDYKANLCQLNQIGGFKKWVEEAPPEAEPPANFQDMDAEQLLAMVEVALKGKNPPAFKDGLLKAYYMLGGARGLLQWGSTHPTAFYNICAKLLPAEIQGNMNSVHEFIIRHSLPPPGYDPHVGVTPSDGNPRSVTYEQRPVPPQG